MQIEPDADGERRGTESSVELQYPILSVHHPNDLWPAPSSDAEMGPPSDVHSDDTGSSLSESAYEMLGDSTVLTSDDEDRDDATDSMISVGRHTPADVTSLAGTEDSDDAGTTSSRLGLDDSIAEAARPSGGAEDVSRSDLTITDGCPHGQDMLEFEEHPSASGDTISVVHTLHVFSEPETASILKHLRTDDPPPRLAATIRQTMTRPGRGLEPDGPLRVLYVGRPSAREPIMSKIASSMAAIPVRSSPHGPIHLRHSSRFNVVPISCFGDLSASAPEVELIDSLGLELVVDECTSATTTKVDGGPDTLRLMLNGTFWYRSRWSDGAFVHEGSAAWQLPHLAVVFCADADGTAARQTRLYARSFLARHAVPTIIISESPLYERPTESYALHPDGIHACLESRAVDPPGYRVIKRLPIDLPTFLTVDARQLSRNLAHLTGLYGGGEGVGTEHLPASARIACTLAAPEDVEKLSRRTTAFAQRAKLLRRRTAQEWRAVAMLGLLLLCALAGTTSTMLYHKFGGRSGVAEAEGSQHMAPPGATLSAASSAGEATLTSRPAGTTGALNPGTGNRPSTDRASSLTGPAPSGPKDLASILTEASSTALNLSKDFRVQVVGDSHIMLRPPQQLALLRKPPVLSVTVTRRGQNIDAELSKLFEGVYSLKLRREDAWGLLNVTVSTKSKPFFEQTFPADFGTPWFRITQRSKAALGESLAWVNTGVQTALRLRTPSAKPGDGGAHRTPHPVYEAITRRARELSDDAAARRATILQQLTSRANLVSGLMSQRTSPTFTRAATNVDRLRKRVSGFRRTASKTLTVARAQKQAGRIWSRVSRRCVGRVRLRTGSTGRKGSCRERNSCGALADKMRM